MKIELPTILCVGLCGGSLFAIEPPVDPQPIPPRPVETTSRELPSSPELESTPPRATPVVPEASFEGDAAPWQP